MKRALKVILIVLLVLVVAVAGYVAYMLATYSRIPDNQQLEVTNNQTSGLETGKSYSAVTYNIGFGAYTQDFSFFMDSGVMKDGTQNTGKSSWANSRESVEDCIGGDIDLVKKLNCDFALLQEVDTGSTRSYQVDEAGLIKDAFPDMGSTMAVNYHSSFLFYPITQPHGFANSCLLTLSNAQISSSVRRSYPVADGLSKFTDLDRCFSVNRIPVANGKELVLVNSHMSAYDKGGTIREKQLALIRDFLTEEDSKDNYVVMGGDFNHALCGSAGIYSTEERLPDWISILDEDDIPEGFSIVEASNIADVPTCRSSDIPYQKGVNYTSTIDGFIVSGNVEATAENIDNDFKYSDHNPVKLTFKLRR